LTYLIAMRYYEICALYSSFADANRQFYCDK